jgi:hypothetical protein
MTATPTITPIYFKQTFISNGEYDGWIIESSENSGTGSAVAKSGKLFLGDNKNDYQYRSILSFDTNLLPNEPIIIDSVQIRVKISDGPLEIFKTHGKILVDLGPLFGVPALGPNDFDAHADYYQAASSGTISSNGWMVLNLKPEAYGFVNRKGITQFRLEFETDDNNDNIEDILYFISGDDSNLSIYWPSLVVVFHAINP